MQPDSLSIEDLPNEVFEQIISNLCVEDRKSASLVSQQWARFAFSRIALGDVLLELNCAQRRPYDYWHVLQHSARNYRNVVLKFAEDEEGHLLKILDKFQYSLEYVSIEQDPDARLLHSEISVNYLVQLLSILGGIRELKVKTVLEISDNVSPDVDFPQLPNLKCLSLGTNCLDSSVIDWSVIAPNIRNIVVPLEDNRTEIPAAIAKFSGQLRVLSVDARFVERDQLTFCQEQFPSLETFRLLYPIYNPASSNEVVSLIQQCTNLTEVSFFNNIITADLIGTLTQCLQLKIVNIDANQVPPTIFSTLSKLPRLSQLILHKMEVQPAMLTSFKCFPELRQLTCLSIRISSPDAFFCQVQKKMPKLVVLELLDRFRFGLNNFNSTGVVSAICENLRFLQILSLVDWAIWDVSTFDKLYRLDHLTELRLKCIGINANGELKPCKSIKKLVLDIDSFNPPDVIPPVSRTPLSELISTSLPALGSIELPRRLLDRTKRSEQEIATLRTLLPSCAFYRKTRLKMADRDYASLL
ncbi:hypothetical protein quinque_014269 [Culex quinquefasciatus]